MKRSITTRLVLMFALAALATFSLIGAALYGVLERELSRHQDDDLNTHLQSVRYSIENYGSADRWNRIQTRIDTLTPADGRVRFWVLSEDPRFQYGKELDEFERISRRPSHRSPGTRSEWGFACPPLTSAAGRPTCPSHKFRGRSQPRP